MKSLKWNDNWKFWPANDAFALVWMVPTDARVLNLPHDAMIEDPSYEGSPNGGNTGYRDGRIYNYSKQLTVSEADKGKRFVLKIEGAYMNATVYVNAEMAGKCMNGYSEFYVDITDYLKEENEIRVQVRNSAMTNSRWYSGSGLYRDVYLMVSEQTFITPTGVKIKTEACDEESAVISVNTEVDNKTTEKKYLKLKTEISDKEGNIVADCQAYAVLFAGEKRVIPQRIAIENPSLWSDLDPALYNYKTVLYCDKCGEIIDEAEGTFGIRTITVDAKKGLRVNGRSVKLRGSCIHHDSGLLGAATYYDAHKRQIQKMKEAGFNAIRMSHHPAASQLLKACDEEGIYVMDEVTDMWNRFKSDYDYALYFNEWWKKDVADMVAKDYNHPSVIMYSVGNEIPEIGSEHGAQIAYEMNSFIKALDDTRFTTAGINGGFVLGDDLNEVGSDIIGKPIDITININEFMTIMDHRQDELVVHPILSKRLEMPLAYLDIAGYNYMTARYEGDAKAYPNRVMVGSETYPPEIARNWGIVKKLNSLIGDFTWTGWDYIGEAGVGIVGYEWGEGGFGAKFPAQLAYCGDIDITGNRRPTSYFREAVFGLTDKPYITVQDPAHYGDQSMKTPWVISDNKPSWNWPGFEGKPITIEVYANADEVELFINNKSLGKKKAGEGIGFITIFDTVYEPGALKAVAYKNNAAISEYILKTADKADEIKLSVDYAGDELIYIPVELLDKDGNLVFGQDTNITLEVEGAEAVGFGSGNPKPKYNFNEGVTETFMGRALVILKKTGSGSISVAVTSDTGLKGSIAL